MKRVTGFALFCVAIGIIVSFFIPNRFWEIVVIIGLMVIGYNMFTSGYKCRKYYGIMATKKRPYSTDA